MPRTVRTFPPTALALLLFGAAIVFDAQDSNATPRLSTGAWQATQSSLVETGQLLVAGHEVPYRIRNLPVSSFPDLPPGVAETLNDRGCLIPQTYEAKGPENVIHGSFERSGSNDWAVLCSAKGQVELLVFFSSAPPTEPSILASASKTDRLQQHDSAGTLGFNWGIDPATPKRVHEAQAGMVHRPQPPDHDCVAETTLEHSTSYHFYWHGTWGSIQTE